MLAYCLSDGLTCNRTVYRRGDIFVLPPQMEGDFGGLNPSQLASKQRQVYGRVMFSLPTSEEIIAAFKAGDVPVEWLSKTESLLVFGRKSEEYLKLHEAAEVLKAKILEENPELKEEDNEDAATVTPFESVQGITETPPKPSSARKTTRKSSTKRKTTKE